MVPLSSFIADQQVGTSSLYALAQAAVAGFDKLPSSVPRVFIATGNLLPFIDPIPNFVTLGPQKVSSVHLVKLFNEAYAKKGYRLAYYSSSLAISRAHLGEYLARSLDSITRTRFLRPVDSPVKSWRVNLMLLRIGISFRGRSSADGIIALLKMALLMKATIRW